MCEQCNAKTAYYVGKNTDEVLPGYILVRATKDGNYMRKNDWGLVRCNNPDFIWSITPVCDPLDGLSDKQIDALAKDANCCKPYEKAVKSLRKSLDSGSFDYCVSLGEAMKKAGWKPEDDGWGAEWLCNYLAKFLKTATVEKELGDNTIGK